MKTPDKHRIYLDYAATTPVNPVVFEFMRSYMSEKYGNAGSLHSFGQEAIAAVGLARETIANSISADFRGIIFTGSATESNNLALRGVMKAARSKISGKPRIIVSSVEHECVLETARDLENDGVEVIYLPVDKNGVVDLEKLKSSLNERTILVSVMYVNNVIGTVQPIEKIGGIIKNFRGEGAYPLFHTDAVQAFPYFDCNVDNLKIDLMTLSSHKIYGPKGAGALYVREPEKTSPIITGGSQEFGLRAGTLNTLAIVGFGKAVELVTSDRQQETRRVSELRDYFWRNLKEARNGVEKNSPDGDLCSPHVLNIYFPGSLASDLLMKFDMAGVAVATGSACSARASRSSHVLKAIGLPNERILGSVRFTLGKLTTREEIDETIERIKIII